MKIKFIQILVLMTCTICQAQNSLKHLNDDFSNSKTISEWKSHHETEAWLSFTKSVKINESEKEFYIEPESSAWFGEFHRGPFYFKEVKGNFTVVTKLKVTGKTTASPTEKYSLAGLMLRNQRPVNTNKNAKGFENWMFLSTGCATKKGMPQFESKNTVNGKSKLKVFPAKTGYIYIAISRIGNTFYQCYRYEDSEPWTLLRVIKRVDMNDKLQVGMLAYTDFWSIARKYFFSREKFNSNPIKGKPDLIARFSHIQFHSISSNENELNYTHGFHLKALNPHESKELMLND